MRRRGCRVLVCSIVALLVSFGTCGRAGAQGSEVIRDYDVHIAMQQNGDLDITEHITYDFGSSARHGIQRQIPTRFHYNNRYDRLEPIDEVHVTASPGTPTQTKISSVSGGKTQIRIGDPDRVITGVRTYDISYRVRRALNAFEDHDELYWNAIGTEWVVRIDRPHVEVTAPANITRVACFAGPTQSRLPCAEAASAGGTATFSQFLLVPGNGLTVVVAVPKGVVQVGKPILEERWSFQRAFSATGAAIGGAVALFLLVVGGFIALVWRGGRDRRFLGSPVDVAFGNEGGSDERVPLFSRRSVPVEFEPPDKLRPGQLGTLVDAVANPLDVTATIVDLAVRGYLRIEEIPKEGWRGKPDWKLVKTHKLDSKLRVYERTLLEGIFKSGQDVKLSELRNTFAAKLHEVQDQLYDDAMDQGWFVRRPDNVRTFWVVMGVLASIVGIAALVLLAVFTHWALLGIPLALGGLLLLIGAHWMPRRTAKGYGVLLRTRGFKRFIDESEKERARFAERKNLFSEYLPYAIVFHATDKWAKAFAGLDGELPDTGGWYVGPGPFTFAGFSSSMDSFTTTTAGTIASTPGTSGSSGFGGGGFSGGGGGGGGGGSW